MCRWKRSLSENDVLETEEMGHVKLPPFHIKNIEINFARQNLIDGT